MSKLESRMEQKKKNTSSQMLLDHCYTFVFLLWPSNSEEVVLWRRALIDLFIMAQPLIHHWADLAQKSIQMCRSHEYSQMLLDNCYAFSLLLQHSTLKEKGPLIDVLWPCSGSAPRRIWPKSEYK